MGGSAPDTRSQRVVDHSRRGRCTSTSARGDRFLRWSAEEQRVQFAGSEGDRPLLAAAPVILDSSIYGVISVTSAHGIAFDRAESKVWMPRFASRWRA